MARHGSTRERHDHVTIDLGAHPGEAAADRYSAWADRMRAKRRRDQETILGPDATAVGDRGYWQAEDVLTGTEEPTSAVDEALAVLGLARDATARELAAAYRNLAKAHHPDRWIGADETTRREHAETMLRVNAAHRVARAALV